MTAKRKNVWMFSGQGSQFLGMGRDLYENEPVFRECMDRCDRIARPWINASLTETIYRADRSAAFDDTHLTHPAIFSVQWSLARTLLARGHRPDVLVGYSLGEMVAHIVAETIPLETGLELLHRHASLMESATPEGGMLAILGKPDELKAHWADIPDVWISARNFENHFVVSGTTRALDQLESRLEVENTTRQRLPIRRAFHSPLMEPAKPEFQTWIATLRPAPPKFDIISSATADRSTGLGSLWTATREPVEFQRTIRRLEAESPDGCAYVDLGPSGTLATFVKYMRVAPRSAFFPIITPWGGAEKNIQSAHPNSSEAS